MKKLVNLIGVRYVSLFRSLAVPSVHRRLGTDTFHHTVTVPFCQQYIAKNVRRLYGLPPDTEFNSKPISRRRNIHDVYGQYYTHLAKETTKCKSLFDYVLLIGMAVRRPQSPITVRFAQLPAVGYSRKRVPVAIRRNCEVKTKGRINNPRKRDENGKMDQRKRGRPCNGSRSINARGDRYVIFVVEFLRDD